MSRLATRADCEVPTYVVPTCLVLMCLALERLFDTVEGDAVVHSPVGSAGLDVTPPT